MDIGVPGMARPCRLEGLALACGLLALPLAAFAQTAPPRAGDAQVYRLDPVHTRVLFAISHAGFSHALGTVSGSTGTLVFDPADWSTAQVTVSVPMRRVDLGDAGWNRAAGGKGLLDVSAWPVATFVSHHVEAKDPTHASVCGTLTLHGVARDTCLEVTFNQLQRLSLPPFHRVAGFSATATLSRKAFGMDAWPTLVGDEVQLRIEAEAVREGARASAPPASDAAVKPPADATQPPPATP
jgi:polyisoprenoid-binding protein YceI